MPVAALRGEQRGVAARMAIVMVMTIVAIGAALSIGPVTTIAIRWHVAAVATAGATLWLAAAIGNVARLRFFSAGDIAGSAGGPASAPVERGVAILQNTLEQTALAIPTYALVAFAIERGVALLVVLIATFSIGRALFWHGYSGGARHRALGFTLTFYPTVLGLLAATAMLVAHAS